MNKIIKKVALSGGPGAGKSTSLPFLQDYFQKQGYQVLVVEEAATEMINEGLAPWTMASNMEFQRQLMERQIRKEEEALKKAQESSAEKILILYDRGLPDNKAFMEADEYLELLEEKGLNPLGALNRYDAIFHMESPARIYPMCYTLENNPARKHSAIQSEMLDQVLKTIWKEHPEFFFIEASLDFGQKQEKLAKSIENYLKESEKENSKKST